MWSACPLGGEARGIDDCTACGSASDHLPVPVTLLSTVVAPMFAAGSLTLTPIPAATLPAALAAVDRNLCGHPLTVAVLTAGCPTLPAAERAFWAGEGLGLAIRPRGGVRASTVEGDTTVTLNDLEAVWVRWIPAPVTATINLACGHAETVLLKPGTPWYADAAAGKPLGSATGCDACTRSDCLP